jgi:hypothetical protein
MRQKNMVMGPDGAETENSSVVENQKQITRQDRVRDMGRRVGLAKANSKFLLCSE